MFSVPLLDLNAQNLPLEKELKAAFDRVLHSGQFILGPEVDAFEAEMAKFTGARHAIGVSSGTDALVLALMALDIKPGDEVLCPSFTFFATAGSVARVGATPVFVDSCPVCFNIDVADARQKVTSRTRAIIPVHLFGQCADMDPLLDLAREHDLHLIEDAAQSLGATYKGRQAGTMGTFGAYSFFPTKNLGALGDAGLLVSNDDELAERARLLRVHGSKPKYYHKYIGGNFRIDALQAAFLRVKLPHYADYTDKRRANAAFYTEELSKLPGVILPGPCPCGGPDPAKEHPDAKIILPAVHSGIENRQPAHANASVPIWNQYTIRVLGQGNRDKLKRFLSDHGIASEIYYPVPLHEQECFSDVAKKTSCLNASWIAKEVLSIPNFAELTRTHLVEISIALGK